MKSKKINVIISLFFAFTMIFPIHVEAINIDSHINKINFPVQLATRKIGENKKTETETVEKCTGDEGILGDVNNEESVAWLLQKILNYMKIFGPTIAIVLGSIDFSKAIITSDEENMKKAQKRFINRLIAAVLLFFVPLIVQILLGLLGFTSNITCGLK